MRAGGNVEAFAVEKSAAAGGRRKKLTPHRIPNDAGKDGIVLLCGYGNGKVWHAVDIIRRAIQRVDDPLHRFRPLCWLSGRGLSMLFGENLMIRKSFEQVANDFFFRVAVRRSD